MTDFIKISDRVSNKHYRYVMRFFDTAALSAEDIISINDEIVEAGIEVCFNRNTGRRSGKPVMECSKCPIEYKCTKRKYDCPFYMDGYDIILDRKKQCNEVSE